MKNRGNEGPFQFTRLRRVPSYLQLAESIATRILDGTIAQGAELPTELELAAQFGVNRSTVREGIRCLEQNGLVSRPGGRRLQATRPSRHALATDLSRALVLHDTTFRDLYEVELAIEPLAARIAANLIDADVLALMQENLEATARAQGQPENLARLDIEFHGLVASASGNPALVLSREPLALLFYSAFKVVLRDVAAAGQRLLDAHQKIYEALAAKDSETAGTWMTKHLNDFKRGYEIAGHSMDAVISSSSSIIAAVQAGSRR